MEQMKIIVSRFTAELWTINSLCWKIINTREKISKVNGSVRKETINYWKDICYDDVEEVPIQHKNTEIVLDEKKTRRNLFYKF